MFYAQHFSVRCVCVVLVCLHFVHGQKIPFTLTFCPLQSIQVLILLPLNCKSFAVRGLRKAWCIQESHHLQSQIEKHCICQVRFALLSVLGLLWTVHTCCAETDVTIIIHPFPKLDKLVTDVNRVAVVLEDGFVCVLFFILAALSHR